MESLESILSDLQGKYKDPNASKPRNEDQVSGNSSSQANGQAIAPASSSLDSLLNDLRSNSQSNSPDYSPTQTPHTITYNQPSPVIDRDMQQVADQQKAKAQEEIAKIATEWLKKLDPLCGEGLWFEEFAKNYSSRLEAAIALLQSK